MLTMLLEPHPHIVDSDDRRGARLFAALMLSHIVLGALVLVQTDVMWRRLRGHSVWADLDTIVIVVGLLVTAVAYVLLRRGRYLAGVLLFIASTASMGLVAPFVPDSHSEIAVLATAVVPVLLTALVFPFRWVLVATLLTATIGIAQLLVADLTPAQTTTGWTLLIIVVTISCLLMVSRAHLSAMERDRWQRIQQSEDRYRHLFETVTDGIYIVGPEGCILQTNPAACAQVGRDTGELAVHPFTEIADPSLVAAAERCRRAPGEPPSRREARLRRSDGSELDVEVALSHIEYDGVAACMVVARDETERKHAQQAQEESLSLLEAVLQQTPVGLAIAAGPTMQLRHVNEAALELLGAKGAEEPIGLTLADVARLRPWEHLDPDGSPAAVETLPLVRAVKGVAAEPREYRIRRRDGSEIWALTGASPVYDRSGRQVAAVLTVMDITDTKGAEQAIRQSEQRLRDILDALTAGVLASDPGGTITYINPAGAALLGLRAPEVIGRPRARFVLIPDDDGRGPSELGSSECELRAADGRNVPVLRTGASVFLGGQECLLESLTDLTGLRQAERDKARLEVQLLHSQKMDAVGQLAGGVAHDFNNLLQAINGYTELAMLAVGNDHAAQKPLGHVAAAGERAARLVGHLLAFSRQQVMAPEVVDLNEVVAAFLQILRRVIGEHIELLFTPGHALDPICADRGMMDQVLMNLCVNARDAMPDGGTLTIATSMAPAGERSPAAHPGLGDGRHVVLAITDTGCGMDAATLSRVFEPFFTTKDAGSGTGLGLSTVYGIVAQHRGTIAAESEPGRGTCFRVYLPAADRPATAASGGADGREQAPTGNETILLAEDDAAVRELSASVLGASGYTVLTAADGEEALRVWERHAREVDLLVLDVVMPRMGGRAVLQHVRSQSPHMPVLFVSGYSPASIHSGFVLDEGLRLLNKPFHPADLLRRVREALDEPPT